MVQIDPVLTPELIVKGKVREFIRAVQQARKNSGLSISDTIHLTVSETLGNLIKDDLFEISHAVGAHGKTISTASLEEDEEALAVSAIGNEYLFKIEKSI